MFENVLIVEDHESANISVRKTLEDLGIARPDYAYYCDDALLRIKKALTAGSTYELLITDLSFDDDGREQQIPGGAELIAAVRKEQPDIKVLVFSAEHKATVIDKLYKELSINGYVRKARNDAQELKAAIEAIYLNRQHFPAHLRLLVQQRNAYDFTEFDIVILSLLSNGMLQKDIPAYLRQENITPSGLSSLEKRLNHMKETLGFSKNEQLVAFCKDIGVI